MVGKLVAFNFRKKCGNSIVMKKCLEPKVAEIQWVLFGTLDHSVYSLQSHLPEMQGKGHGQAVDIFF